MQKVVDLPGVKDAGADRNRLLDFGDRGQIEHSPFLTRSQKHPGQIVHVQALHYNDNRACDLVVQA